MNNNIDLALNIINYLYTKGFSNYCIAPGSRSAPLAIALNLLKKNGVKINIHIHFDERALGFLGLGLAKGCNEPTVIITTSGSAVANLFPAVMEAYYTHTELLLLTADRPYELHECGANQTCEQKGIFGSYTLYDDIPTFSSHISTNTIINRIDKILFKNKYLNIPIHLNISFREPLYNSNLDEYTYSDNNIVNYNYPIYNTSVVTDITSDLDFDNLFNNSIIIIGSLNYNDSLVINEIINKINEYTILDIQSNLRHNLSDFIVKDFDFLSNEQIDYLHNNYKKIIVISGKFISQKIIKFINDFKSDTYFISKNFDNYNSISKNSINLHISYTELNKKLHKSKKANKTPIIGTYCLEDKWDELSVIKHLANSCEDSLFLGNSTVCRFADALLSIINKKIYTNRGVSGIDGLIATSCGLSYTQNIISVIGDTTALYDLSSISLLKKYRVKLIIINNNGGNIFEKFPIPNEIKQELFLNPHNVKFEKIADSFEIKYFKPSNLTELDSIISMKFNESIIIELNFPTFESVRKLSTL